MKILLIEDEIPAANRLKRLLHNLDPEIQIIGELDSVEESIQWFATNPPPDLVLLDIHLADGESFEIFEKQPMEAPVIFTTAYSDYAIRAFELNSIDYLLKPIKEADLAAALEKYQKRFDQKEIIAAIDYPRLAEALKAQQKTYQKRLVVKQAGKLKTIEIADIAYFFIAAKITLLRTTSGQDYITDHKMEELEGLLDPGKFFRINRKHIVCVDAIGSMLPHTKAHLKLEMNPPFEEEMVVSSERAGSFKEWLRG
jgi:two-component system LytT family response regulator